MANEHPPLPSEAQRAAQIEVLLEDFKARWQELLNFEAEVSRWFTLYVTAVIAVVGWAMANIPPSGVQALLKQHDGLNTIFVLTLALLNPVYILALAFNGYRIQQIGQYLYSHVGVRLSILTGEPFNVWEDWRRMLVETPGAYGPEWIRRIYYISIALVPAFVSGLLLLVYSWFEGSTQARWSGHNCFAYIIVLVNVGAAGLSIWTSAQNSQWSTLIARRLREEEQRGVKRRVFFANSGDVNASDDQALPQRTAPAIVPPAGRASLGASTTSVNPPSPPAAAPPVSGRRPDSRKPRR